jgi:hypothetical protein
VRRCGCSRRTIAWSTRGFARLQADVEAGLRELDAGASKPFDDEAVARIKQAGRAKLKAVKSDGK